MPFVVIPSVSNNFYHDGEPVSVNDDTVPVLVITDANGKSTVMQGSVRISDVTPPAFQN